MIGAITGAVSALGNLIQGGINMWQQHKQQKYQQQLQQQIFQREDTAVQRRADDMAKAGLSKTLAAGGGANAGAIAQTQAPQMSGMDNLSDGVVRGMSADSEINATKERNNLVKQQVESEKINQDTMKTNQELGKANIEKVKAETDAIKWDTYMSSLRGVRRNDTGLSAQLMGLPKIVLDLLERAKGNMTDPDYYNEKRAIQGRDK